MIIITEKKSTLVTTKPSMRIKMPHEIINSKAITILMYFTLIFSNTFVFSVLMKLIIRSNSAKNPRMATTTWGKSEPNFVKPVDSYQK